MLKYSVEEGRLHGIPIGDFGLQLLCELFVDNTGLFLEAIEDKFSKAMIVISYYERISSAKLSLAKSTIIQMDNHPEHAWLHSTGCRVAI